MLELGDVGTTDVEVGGCGFKLALDIRFLGARGFELGLDV